jgi:hypothetical protein
MSTPVDTAALRRFADRYEERMRRDLRAAGLPKEGDMPGPSDLIRAAADELDRLRAGAKSGTPRYEPTGSPDGGPWGYDWIRRVE